MRPLFTKFLLVDDDADDATIFCEALARIDPVIQCLSVDNGREALAALSEGKIDKPDMIFLDINMPVMNGWDFLKKLKVDVAVRDVPVIIYSTSAATHDIEMAYSLGATLFITKPENFRELCEILEILAHSTPESMLQHLSRFESVRMR